MVKKRHGVIIETPTEARQAERGPSVLFLLSLSLIFVVLGMAVVWYVFFRTSRARWLRLTPAMGRGLVPGVRWSPAVVWDNVEKRASFACIRQVVLKERFRKWWRLYSDLTIIITRCTLLSW